MGKEAMAARDVLMLEGVLNFRDIGGYATADGGRVRCGRMFRSAAFAEATEDDRRRLDALGLKLVYDLRATAERGRRPQGWPAAGCGPEIAARDMQQSVGNLVDAIVAPDATPEQIVGRMLATYRHLPYEQAESYAAVLARAAAGDLPMVFNCSAGKDRTGVLAALLLDLLGVPRAVVIEDYLHTQEVFEALSRFVLSGPTAERLAAIDPALWTPMMRTDRSYIEAMFAEIERRHGDTAAYAADILHFTDLAGLRRQLVEPAP